MDLQEIQRHLRQGSYEFSLHAQQERLEENLDVTEIEAALIGTAEILEEYPNDPRGESCLVLGFAGPRPIHVVGVGHENAGRQQDIKGCHSLHPEFTQMD